MTDDEQGALDARRLYFFKAAFAGVKRQPSWYRRLWFRFTRLFR